MCLHHLSAPLLASEKQTTVRQDCSLTDAACCRYKHEIRKEDKEALRQLIKVQYHYQVSPEITRELDASRYAIQHCIVIFFCTFLQPGHCNRQSQQCFAGIF